MNAAQSKRREQGFTLVELLVVLTLLSLLTLLLFGGLRFGVRAWDGAVAHSEGADEVRVVQGLLRREIEQAYPSYDMTDPLHPVVNFVGAENALTFLAPTPQAVGGAGRSWITLASSRNRELSLRAVPEFAVSNSWSSALLSHVAAIRFSYYDGGNWSSQWRHKSALPRLVRIHIDFGAADRRVWPDLVVAPRIESACDSSTNSCQERT